VQTFVPNCTRRACPKRATGGQFGPQVVPAEERETKPPTAPGRPHVAPTCARYAPAGIPYSNARSEGGCAEVEGRATAKFVGRTPSTSLPPLAVS
jgi:hypothetical protein